MKRVIAFGLAALILGVLVTSVGAELRKGQKLPQATLTDLNGKEVKLGGKQDKILVVDFWATWCGPCREAIPFLQELHTKYSKQGVQVVGIALDSGPEQEVKRFVENNEMTYTIAVPSDKRFGDRYRIEGFPTLYIVDKKGLIRHVQVGYGPDVDQAILKVISDLLAE